MSFKENLIDAIKECENKIKYLNKEINDIDFEMGHNFSENNRLQIQENLLIELKE